LVPPPDSLVAPLRGDRLHQRLLRQSRTIRATIALAGSSPDEPPCPIARARRHLTDIVKRAKHETLFGHLPSGAGAAQSVARPVATTAVFPSQMTLTVDPV
jgi:hypothetical protein